MTTRQTSIQLSPQALRQCADIQECTGLATRSAVIRRAIEKMHNDLRPRFCKDCGEELIKTGYGNWAMCPECDN